jgi:hypothetical protein
LRASGPSPAPRGGRSLTRIPRLAFVQGELIPVITDALPSI